MGLRETASTAIPATFISIMGLASRILWGRDSESGAGLDPIMNVTRQLQTLCAMNLSIFNYL
jgi:hypothetical protein